MAENLFHFIDDDDVIPKIFDLPKAIQADTVSILAKANFLFVILGVFQIAIQVKPLA